MALFIPTYFAPISQYAEMVKAEEIVFEVEDNFQKQTYRNRCYICSPNGKQSLNIPVKHLKTNDRKKTKDTLVENNFPWQAQHFKSLQAAYRSSPFFEFFEEDLLKIFDKKYQFLLDVNIDTFLFVCDALQIKDDFKKTSAYEINPENSFRNLAISKTEHDYSFPKYTQNFENKHGFIYNLSILDLLFMEGGNAYDSLTNVN